MLKIIIPVIIICFILVFAFVLYTYWYLFPTSFVDIVRDIRDSVQGVTKSTEQSLGIPPKYIINDNDFIVEEYVTDLHQPTTMAFLDDDIIILEKNTGKVLLIQDGKNNNQYLLDFNVNSYWESGLLGVAVNDNDVYFYLTETEEEDGGEKIGNNIYRFYWDGKELINKKLINSLGSKAPAHNGGVMAVGLDGQVYAVIGDQGGGLVGGDGLKDSHALTQNSNQGEFDDSGVIIRVGLDEEIIKPKDSQDPLEHYYAIGIRNSFGLAIDPITGKLWDTENGRDNFDEVNLVSENFNSGWAVTMGPASEKQIAELLNFDKYTYDDPKFSWEKTIAPTGLAFADSEAFNKYRNELFVGGCMGQIFKFKLDDNRDNFVFDSTHLQDLVANMVKNESGENIIESLDEILFGDGFGCITDIKFGPDGNLYVVSLSDNMIYRIIPK